jgi:hypothetical protein
MGMNQHVILEDEKWQVWGAGNTQSTKGFNTQEEAVSYAKEITIYEKSELIIHDEDGEICKKYNYKKEPR